MVGSYMRTRRFLMESGWHGGGATPAEPLSNTFVAGMSAFWTNASQTSINPQHVILLSKVLLVVGLVL